MVYDDDETRSCLFDRIDNDVESVLFTTIWYTMMFVVLSKWK